MKKVEVEGNAGMFLILYIAITSVRKISMTFYSAQLLSPFFYQRHTHTHFFIIYFNYNFFYYLLFLNSQHESIRREEIPGLKKPEIEWKFNGVFRIMCGFYGTIFHYSLLSLSHSLSLFLAHGRF